MSTTLRGSGMAERERERERERELSKRIFKKSIYILKNYIKFDFTKIEFCFIFLKIVFKELDTTYIELYFKKIISIVFSKNSILQISSSIFFFKNCIELDFTKIEFYVAVFNRKSHASNFHYGTKHVKHDFSEIEFYAKLNFAKIEFQNWGVSLDSFKRMTFCYIVLKLRACIHFSPMSLCPTLICPTPLHPARIFPTP